MKLTTFSDYTLRVLIYLAINPDRLVTIAEIAERHAISENHLMKVVHHLARGDLVESVRGKGGGIRLAAAPETIRIGRVVRESEGEMAIVECMDPQTNACKITSGCRLAKILVDAFAALYAHLDQFTLADLVQNDVKLRKLLTLTDKPSVSSH